MGLVARGVGGGEVEGGCGEEARGHEAAVGDCISYRVFRQYIGDTNRDECGETNHCLCTIDRGSWQGRYGSRGL